MTYSVNTPIVGHPTGTASEALAWLDVKAGAETEYVAELWGNAGLWIVDPAIAFAQAAWETGDFSSPRWLNNRNPAGLAIEKDTDPDPAKLTGREAAELHYWALLYITRRTETAVHPTKSAYAFMDRWREKVRDPNFPHPVLTIADLGKHYVDSHGEPQAVWGWDPNYARGIVSKLNAIFPNRQEVTPMATTYSTTIPGLPGGPLVTDYPVSLMIIPESQKLNRPGIIAKTPRRGVQHGAGNPNSFARGDAIWAYNGAKNDHGQPTQTSFHATADEYGVTVLIPANEVTWQAADGAGQGNMNGFSCEMSENAVYRSDMGRLRRNIYVNADFMGRVAARLNIAKPEQHWDFNAGSADRHNCPNILRTMSIDGVPCWTIYTNQWNVSKIQELANMNPTPPKPERKPYPITWEAGDVGPQTLAGKPALAYLFQLTAKRAATRRVGASSKEPTFGERLVVGKKYVAIGGVDVSTPAGRLQPWVILDDLARVPMSMFEEKLPRP